MSESVASVLKSLVFFRVTFILLIGGSLSLITERSSGVVLVTFMLLLGGSLFDSAAVTLTSVEFDIIFDIKFVTFGMDSLAINFEFEISLDFSILLIASFLPSDLLESCRFDKPSCDLKRGNIRFNPDDFFGDSDFLNAFSSFSLSWWRLFSFSSTDFDSGSGDLLSWSLLLFVDARFSAKTKEFF